MYCVRFIGFIINDLPGAIQPRSMRFWSQGYIHYQELSFNDFYLAIIRKIPLRSDDDAMHARAQQNPFFFKHVDWPQVGFVDLYECIFWLAVEPKRSSRIALNCLGCATGNEE